MPRTTTKDRDHKKTAKDPRQIAVEAVADWYDAITEAADYPERYSVTLENGVAAVLEALEAAHVKEHGPLTDNDDAGRQIFAQEAGYLVGVQVGLRLRAAGGAR